EHLHVHQVQGPLIASFLPGLLGADGCRTLLLVGGRWAVLAELPGLPALYPEPFSQMEGGGQWLGRVRGGLNPGQPGDYPLAPLQISGFWKQMVPSATQMTGGRYNGEVNSNCLLCQQMDRFSTYYQLQETVSITRT
ncbi:hypothetical protein H1C71_000148, partial [Ictidomys tridecemlineatus]